MKEDLIKDNSLRVIQRDGYHYYKIGGGLCTGQYGFFSFLDALKEAGGGYAFIYPIHFNDVELSGDEIKQFWEQVDNFRAIKTKHGYKN